MTVLAALCQITTPGFSDTAAPVTRFTASPVPDDIPEWQREFRAALAETLGLPHMPAPGPRVSRTTESIDVRAYRRERIELEVEPGEWAPAYVFVPTHGRPVATIIALHGHGAGKSVLIGIMRTQADRVAVHQQRRAFGREAARRGYAVIVPDQRGFGERMHPDDRRDGALDSCRRFVPAAHERGRTLYGERVYDVQQWIAYAATRPEMDGARIGLLGHSGGGLTALFTIALDARVDVAVISSYFGTWAESVAALPHCPCNDIPGLPALADLAELACLAAPRPLLISAGAEDEWVPAAPVRRAFSLVQAFYAQGGGGPATLALGPGGHRVYGEDVWPFLQQHLPVEP